MLVMARGQTITWALLLLVGGILGFVEFAMTLDQAKEIVGQAEDEFASGRHIEDAFEPFSSAGAATRIDALNALYLVIADFFAFCVSRSRSPDAMKAFEEYANASGSIAWRILCGNVHDLAKVRDALGGAETVRSFVDFLKTLNPENSEFWPQVYARLGLQYPAESDLNRQDGAALSHKKAWWRFW